MDVDSIPAGVDFLKYLDKQVAAWMSFWSSSAKIGWT